MNAWAILLRVMLSISLILNGSGAAVASTQMHMAAKQDLSSQARPSASAATHLASMGAKPPCHQHPSSDTVSSALPTPADSAGIDKDMKHHSPGDRHAGCCNSGVCQCDCVHLGNAGIPVYDLRHPAIEHANVPAVMTLGYTAPLLPHLIRPPISS